MRAITTLSKVLIAILLPFSNLFAQAPALSLESAVQMFLERNVEVQAARYNIDQARAEQIAARVRPNPVLAIAAENLKVSGEAQFNLREFGAFYTETIELGGKRRLRESVADLAVSAAESRFQDVLRQKLGEVKRSYFEALLARHNLDIAAENRAAFEELARFNVARFEEGAIAEGDLLRVRLERIKFDSTVKQAELQLTQSMIHLLEKLEEPDFGVRPLADTLESPLVDLSLNRLMQSAFQNRPDLKAADTEIALARERLSLEEARAVPDVSPFAGYKRIASSNTVLFGVTVPLAVRDRNQGGIAHAAAQQQIAKGRRDVVENSVRVEVELAFRAYEAARDQVTIFRDQLLQQAEESQTITLALYEEGATDLLPVLEAQRTRTEIRQQYYRTLFEYQASRIALELAVGGRIQP